MAQVPKPLFRDPFYDGATDPTVIWNREAQQWWMFYTSRRAWSPSLSGVEWVHGSDIGIASSSDGGATWTYRGTATGLGTSPRRDTFWAPEVIDDGSTYHMYVSVIEGVPDRWSGHERHIRHYTSTDLSSWTFESVLELTSNRVIDACIFPIPSGGHRMWFKDEANGAHTYSADSPDLYTWTVSSSVVDFAPHEGPNVFELAGTYWMIVDDWAGQSVLQSEDLNDWTLRGRILDRPGTGEDDGAIGQHADVVVAGENAYVFYFTHPGRTNSDDGLVNLNTPEERRSSIQVARAHVVDGVLVCDRDESLTAPILPTV